MALIGDIGRYAVHDGPGIRTTVFFKGCPLHCPWCHNPEFLAPQPEVAFYHDRCLNCGDCEAVCPEKAINLDRATRIDRGLCSGCGLCAAACPTLALRMVGKNYELEELVEILRRDRLFYQTSGGGVTLSGGEPTAQMDFCGALLQRLQEEHIHTAIETNGFFPWAEFEKTCLPGLDLILFDLKLADPSAHQRIIGQANDMIIDNLTRLLASRPDDVIVRIPLIPNCTATEPNMAALADIIRQAGARRCALLGYHPHGKAKADKVGREPDNTFPDHPMNQESVAQWHKLFHWAELVEF